MLVVVVGVNVFSTRCQNSQRAENHMQFGRKIAFPYTSRDLAGKYVTNITKRRQPEIYKAPLETIHILTQKPSLCKQGECLLGLNMITI